MKPVFKIFFGAVVVLAIASPYVAGRIIENHYNAFINQLNTNYKDKVTIVGKYNRGIFSSTATTDISLAGAPSTFELTHNIHHGPLIFIYKGLFSLHTYIPHGYKLGFIDTMLTGELESHLTDLYNKKEAYAITTILAMNGDVLTQVQSFPLDAKLGIGELNYGGLTANINTNIQLNSITADATMPAVEYSEVTNASTKQSLSLTTIKLDFSNDATNEAKFNLTMANAKIVDNVTNDMVLDQLSLSTDYKTVKDLIEATINLGFNKLSFQALEYGPLSLMFHVNNLSAKAMHDLMKNPGTAQSPDLPAPLTVELLANKISVDANFKNKTPDGDVIYTGHADVGGPGITAATEQQILPTVNATQHVQLSTKLAYKILAKYAEKQIQKRAAEYFLQNPTSPIKNPYVMTPEQLQATIGAWVKTTTDALIAQKYFILKDDILTMDQTYAKSTLTINGVVKTQADLDQLKIMFEVMKAPAKPAGTTTTAPTTAPSATPVPTAPAAPSSTSTSTTTTTTKQ